jgi:hypothetical protein
VIYLVLSALLSLGIATVVRNTAVSIGAVLDLLFGGDGTLNEIGNGILSATVGEPGLEPATLVRRPVLISSRVLAIAKVAAR